MIINRLLLIVIFPVTVYYLLLLDASKTFDRIEYYQFCNRLRDMNMCPIVLRLLINMYINKKILAKWNSMLSNQYCISNGAKQCGCLSPTVCSISFK